MHETAIAWEILETARRTAGDVAIERIGVRLGEMSGVVEDSLRFAFDALKHDAGCEDTVLQVERVAVEVECVQCGSTKRPPGELLLLCESCGAPMRILNGEQAQICWIETADASA